MCGPQAMYNFLDEEIAKLGPRRKIVRREFFGTIKDPWNQPSYPADARGKSFNLRILQYGQEFVRLRHLHPLNLRDIQYLQPAAARITSVGLVLDGGFLSASAWPSAAPAACVIRLCGHLSHLPFWDPLITLLISPFSHAKGADGLLNALAWRSEPPLPGQSARRFHASTASRLASTGSSPSL